MKKLKYPIYYFIYLFLVWAFFRYFFVFKEEVEEFIIKPIVWLLPIFYLLKKEKLKISSLGITSKNLFKSIYLTSGLGVVFAIEAVVINFVKHKGFDFGAVIGQKAFLLSIVITLATAVSEEIAFRGYIFNRFWKATKNEWISNIISSLFWTLIHIPITFFVLNLSTSAGLTFLGLTALFGIGSSFIFARTENIISSILLHLLWQWPIILFR